MRRSVVLCVLLLVSGRGIAQYADFKFTNLHIPNAPRLSVKCIYHDNDGYIWLGSWHSLAKLDGNRIRYYSSRELSNEQFTNTAAKLIFEDRKGTLWIATDRGCLMAYNKDLDKFIAVNDSTTSLQTQASSYVEDEHGNFWIGTLGAGLFYFNPQTKQLTRYVNSPNDSSSLPDNRINEITVDLNHDLWIATEAGLCRYDRGQNKFIRYRLYTSESRTRSESIQAMHASADGKLYLGTYDGFLIYNYRSGKFRHLSTPSSHEKAVRYSEVSEILEPENGKIWISVVGGGIHIYDKEKDAFTRIVQDENDPQSLPSNFISRIYFDRNNTLWVSTFENGIVLLDQEIDKIRCMKHTPGDANSLPPGNIFTILPVDDSIVWVGVSRNGLNRLNIRTRKNQQFLYNPELIEGEGNNTVESIKPDKSGNLWVGTFNGGINQLDLRKKSFTRYLHHPKKNSITDNSTGNVLVDRSGNVWGVHNSGAELLDPLSGKIVNFTDDSLSRTLNFSLCGSGLFETTDGIWFARPNQLVVYDKAKNIFIKPTMDAAMSSKFTNVVTVGEKIYVFTDDHRLKQLIPEQPTKIRTEDVLEVDEDILAACDDDKGNIWAISARCIIRIDPDLKTVSKVHFFSELPNEPIFPDIVADNHGRIFYSLIDEVNWFNADEIEEQRTPSKIVLTDFRVFNSTIEISDDWKSSEKFDLQKHISRLDVVELEHSQNFFSFEFSALEYFRPHQVFYAYKMEGFDHAWIDIGNRTYANYTNLDPGEYVFKVKASYPERASGGPEASIKVVILPPVWGTWWFISLGCLIVISLTYAFLRYKVSQSLRLQILRNKIASDLHDEVGSSLTRIALYSDLLQNNTQRGERKNYLKSISTLSRDVINTMSDIIWSIDDHNESLGDLITRMKDCASDLLRPKDISVDITVENVNEKKTLDPILKQNLYLIFKESINNIVKHSNATEVRVYISNNAEGFSMVIHDNGKGIDLEGDEKGHGLRSMDKRALAVNAVLQISNGNGTTIRVTRQVI